MEGRDADMVEEVLGSPTEIAEDSQPDQEHGVRPKMEKRKREERLRDHPGVVPVPGSDNEEENESPSKRPPRASRGLTASDIREILSGHVSEMKAAWSTFQGRLTHLEGIQEKQGEALDCHGEMLGQLKTRTKVIEKDMVSHRQAQEQTARHLDELTEEVKNMKVQWEDLQSKPPGNFALQRGAPSPALAGPSDPWSAYLRHRGEVPAAQNSAPVPRAVTDPSDRGDALTEEEKRTLVIGGWARDTRRAVIEEEFSVVLAQEAIKSLTDAEKLLVYGPRRSVGMLRFTLREGEAFNDMRNRMWETVKAIANMKHVLASTKELGEQRTLWASFVKTKTARAKSSLVSMVRRVTIALALDAKNEQGGIPCLAHTQPTAYDCDWNLGTIWCGSHKLASATHKQPKDGDCVLVSGGWVSLTAVSSTAGCSLDEAKLAFEREL